MGIQALAQEKPFKMCLACFDFFLSCNCSICLVSWLVGSDYAILVDYGKNRELRENQLIVGLNDLSETSLLRQPLISTQAPPAALPAVLPSSAVTKFS